MSEEMKATIELAVEMVNKNGGAIYCYDTETGKRVKVSCNIANGCKTMIELGG